MEIHSEFRYFGLYFPQTCSLVALSNGQNVENTAGLGINPSPKPTVQQAHSVTVIPVW
jgi:hypothetical protein